MKLSDNESFPFTEVDLCYCDNHLLVVNKPAGLLTQPDQTGALSLERVVKEWVKKEYGKPGEVFLHCIHRLDKPVSGLVLFARTSKALSRLNEQSRSLEIQRVYVAEVEGIVAEKRGRLDHYLIHKEHRAVVGRPTDSGAKHARLTFEVLHFLHHSTLLQVQLETGRYHQIRAQCSAIGHPIVGDRKYGSHQGDGGVAHLHCSELSFRHPVTKEVLQFKSVAPFV